MLDSPPSLPPSESLGRCVFLSGSKLFFGLFDSPTKPILFGCRQWMNLCKFRPTTVVSGDAVARVCSHEWLMPSCLRCYSHYRRIGRVSKCSLFQCHRQLWPTCCTCTAPSSSGLDVWAGWLSLQHPECNNYKNIEQPNYVHLSVCLWYSQIFWNIHKTISGECFMTLIGIG